MNWHIGFIFVLMSTQILLFEALRFGENQLKTPLENSKCPCRNAELIIFAAPLFWQVGELTVLLSDLRSEAVGRKFSLKKLD